MKTIIIAIVVLSLWTTNLATAQSKHNQFLDKLIEIEHLIVDHYADTLDRNKLMEITIRSVFGYLDPHTVYKTPQEAEEEEMKYGAERTGIGAQAATMHDTLTIISVEPHTSGYKAGLRAGMQIDSINGQPVTNRILSSEQLIRIINARQDSITLTMIKGKGRKKIVIPRYRIKNTSIESCYSPNDSTTYIKIFKFTKYTGEDFENTIKKIGHKKLRNVIIDLRDNPGGYLQVCEPICNQIIPANMLLYTTIKSHEEAQSVFANKHGLLKHSRIYVLINENSASASEVIASCIQDNDRGVIIGRRSFGKALTQLVTLMPDGSKVLISNGRIFSPSGRCIQKDYVRGNFADYYNELNQRRIRNEHICRDSIITSGKPQCYTVMKHRLVHGRMGVVPDCFVPEDSTNIIATMIEDNDFNDDLRGFTMIFVDAHRARLHATYGSFKNFCKTFYVSDNMISEFALYRHNKSLGLRNITENNTPSAHETQHLRIQIKAYIAKSMYGNTEFRELINNDDSDFQAAMHLIEEPEAYWNYLK
ncbi:MAG: hypothetical protein K6F33_11255 [Bacteroidales bacterium]|nr:hypothetical protein [Bacteroidales bacterium]